MLDRASGLVVSKSPRTVANFSQARREAAGAITLVLPRIAGEVARLATTLKGLDALVFTAVIGENQPEIRARVPGNLRRQ